MAGPTTFFAKSTILLLYLRVFTVERVIRYCVWLGLAWNLLIYWIGVPLTAYFCVSPSGKAWVVDNLRSDRCMKLTVWGVIQGALAVVLDLYIFLLPIPIVLRLQMSLKRRLSILGVFGTSTL